MASKRCPQCAETIKLSALVCRHCGHKFTEAELSDAVRRARVSSWLTAGAAITLVVIMAKCVASAPDSPGSPQTVAGGWAITPNAKRLQLDNFSWQATSEYSCYANASVTNVGDTDINFARLTIQFFKKDQLVGGEDFYLAVHKLPPGGTSTWKAVYDCPGRNTTAQITGVSRGESIEIVDGPRLKR